MHFYARDVKVPGRARRRDVLAATALGTMVLVCAVDAVLGGHLLQHELVMLALALVAGMVGMSTLRVGFAIGLSNPSGSVGSLTLSPGVCALEAEVVNRNPTSAPFDEQE